MKEFEVRVTIYNNCLKERREELGLTQVQLAEVIGVDFPSYNKFEAMKLSPLTVAGGWKERSMKIADYYKCLPEDLFPDAVLRIKKRQASFKVNAAELCSRISVQQRRLLMPSDSVKDGKRQ